MNESEVLDIAKSAVKLHEGWREFPADAVLMTCYYNPDKHRWVMEWQHRVGDAVNDADRILVWISDDGAVTKLRVSWSELKLPHLSSSPPRSSPSSAGIDMEEIKREIARRVKERTGRDIEIARWRKIRKERWVFHIPLSEVKDYYWTGYINGRLVLVDTDGRIVGEFVIPSVNVSAHVYGPGAKPEGSDTYDECACWTYIRDEIIKPRFDAWFKIGGQMRACIPITVPSSQGGGTVSCSGNYLSMSDYDIELLNTANGNKGYACIAHGGYYGFHFVAYEPEYSYAANEADRISWGYRYSIESLLANRGPYRFIILIHCGAMDRLGPGCLEYEFRKGWSSSVVVVGLRETTNHSWSVFYDWISDFLSMLGSDYDLPIKDAFDDACDTYPVMKGTLPGHVCSDYNSQADCEEVGCCWDTGTSTCYECGAHIDFTGDEQLTLRHIIQGDVCEIV